MTDLIGMHALGPEKYFDIQDKQEGRDIDRGKLAETERSNRAGESLTMRSQNISAQNAALDREIKRAELENKKLDRQAQNSTNELRKQALEQQIAANQQKMMKQLKKNVSPRLMIENALIQLMTTQTDWHNKRKVYWIIPIWNGRLGQEV
ncbi:phage DNA ejection protein [Candidatus Arsenophonus triatominarum]|uniref:phage DNA ejection protein n=1 Tax=Candidatus Arsenophonus triatominarum TaxID=57911 RepID=UPI0007C56D16|nr:phage DNA ejection protein [Candidatus Arsenophonus triatominarum]